MRLPLRVFAGVGLLSGALVAAQTPPEPQVPSSLETLTPPPPTVTRIQETPATTEAAPQPLGFESDVYCFGYVGGPSEAFAATTVGAESIAEQIDYVTGDRLYLDGGHDRGLKAGDEFWLVTAEELLVHPTTGKELGRFYMYRGRAVVDFVEPRTATATVTSACTDIPMGSFLKPFEPVPIPLARKTAPAVAGDPPSGKVKGHVIYTRDGIVAVGTDHNVIVDLGAAHGLQPGDFLTIFRYAVGREYGIKPVGRYWVNLPPPAGVTVPRTYLGELAILVVGDRWAIGRITDSYRLIEVGDEVELK
jgi:hypothetical protein